MPPPPSPRGFVYILSSPNSEFVKIGGTDYPPLKRIQEINRAEPYRAHGPWGLLDFREVLDWRKVERHLHYGFRSKLVREVAGQKELFRVSGLEAVRKLGEVDESLIVSKPKVDRMFQDEEMLGFMVKLFRFTGLLHWIDLQGAWTFCLFPRTGGGRYYTLNIGPHEVAFCTLPKPGQFPCHMILMDRLILDFPSVRTWLQDHRGEIIEKAYASALPRAASVPFQGTFQVAEEFMRLDGVRRALIAYWNEALIGLKESNKLSSYAKSHNWNAVARINALLKNHPP